MKEKIKRGVRIALPYVAVIVLVVLVKRYVVAPIEVNGDSMYSTLKENDVMLLDKIGYKLTGIKRFDIVVIKYKEKHLIKRVIGLPGETVRVANNKLYIDNRYVKETFLDTGTKTDSFEYSGRIPEGCYFVMGDHREVSLDSRSLGVFSIDDIEGVASLTLYPFNRFGFKG